MKKVNFLILAFIVQSFVFGQAATRKIQIAILFDTSGSMEGLIEQAKSTIWSVVNTATEMSADGQAPTLEIALYDYGNSGISTTNWIRKHCNFITDLDSISGHLFSLRTNGGEEYCAAVIQTAMNELSWSSNPQDLKLIYIAGNEMFNQGPVDYKVILKDATQRNIVVNTIYCGPYEQGVRELWLDGVQLGQGSYFNIDSNQEVFFIETPYDNEIQKYNDSLNSTYIGYGEVGMYRAEKQKKEDLNAGTKGQAASVERAVAKSNLNYKNNSWDLVDGVKAGQVNLAELKEEDLPKEMQGMSKEEREKYILTKRNERQKFQNSINNLSVKRNEFIEIEKKKSIEAGKEKDLGEAMKASLKSTAQKNGFTHK